MRHILSEISEHYSEDQKLNTYWHMKEHPGWPVHQEILLLIRGKMAEELLSFRFTKLDKDEKDAQQRAYAYVDEIIRFLLNPMEKAIKKANFRLAIDKELLRMGATK